MALTLDDQKLEPGSEIRLIQIDGSAFGLADALLFHAHNVAHTAGELANSLLLGFSFSSCNSTTPEATIQVLL